MAAPVQSAPASEVRTAYELMRQAQSTSEPLSYERRLAALETLIAVTRESQAALVEAIDADFAGRSADTTRIGDIFPVVQGVKYICQNLKSWMKPERRRVAAVFKPGTAEVRCEPKGVVGVIAPWNFPFHLAILPAAYALAAGNRVLLKPSELSARTAEVMAKCLNERFSPDLFRVINGGVDVAQALCGLPLDHILFTGSTRVGREVLKRAAENLTPVTLELGGKCPALIHPTFPVARAAERLVAGKFLSAGQFCVTPDYVLVPEQEQNALLEHLKRVTTQHYPSLRDNPDYTAVFDDSHLERLRALLEDARDKGATIHEHNPAGEDLSGTRKLAPTFITGVRDDMRVAKEEIFGPILPLVSYTDFERAIQSLRGKPAPLALYYFDTDSRRVDWVLGHTVSGGVTINDTVVHLAQNDMPFGGVGASGMGAYRGREGFDTFSHKRSVFRQSKLTFTNFLLPPYGERTRKLLDMLIGR